MGKTALSLNIALNIIKKYKLPILFFSLEMSKEQIMYRLLSMETNISQIDYEAVN
jgi:replicative DNA helicase